VTARSQKGLRTGNGRLDGCPVADGRLGVPQRCELSSLRNTKRGESDPIPIERSSSVARRASPLSDVPNGKGRAPARGCSGRCPRPRVKSHLGATPSLRLRKAGRGGCTANAVLHRRRRPDGFRQRSMRPQSQAYQRGARSERAIRSPRGTLAYLVAPRHPRRTGSGNNFSR
jgi:hypothetical protein